MTYDAQITFVLDTICPWYVLHSRRHESLLPVRLLTHGAFRTYLGKRRLSRALDIVRKKDTGVNFSVKYMPYQLYPNASQEGEDKYEW